MYIYTYISNSIYMYACVCLYKLFCNYINFLFDFAAVAIGFLFFLFVFFLFFFSLLCFHYASLLQFV